MKTFLDQNDLRRLITRIKESLGLKADKTSIPTKLSDLDDDTALERPINYATNADMAMYSDSSTWAEEANNARRDGVGNDIIDTYATKAELKTTESIAKGRATGYVFDTLSDLETWLENSENVSKLVLGDNLYIRATDVPDYWWDGEIIQPLETQKVDLSEYATKEELSEAIGKALEGDY